MDKTRNITPEALPASAGIPWATTNTSSEPGVGTSSKASQPLDLLPVGTLNHPGKPDSLRLPASEDPYRRAQLFLQ